MSLAAAMAQTPRAYPSALINVVWMAIGLYGVFGRAPAGPMPAR